MMKYKIPTRGLLGLRNSILTVSRGTAVLNTVFDEYGPWAGDINTRDLGSLVILISMGTNLSDIWITFSDFVSLIKNNLPSSCTRLLLMMEQAHLMPSRVHKKEDSCLFVPVLTCIKVK